MSTTGIASIPEFVTSGILKTELSGGIIFVGKGHGNLERELAENAIRCGNAVHGKIKIYSKCHSW